MWINTREETPTKDGSYVIQTIFGEVLPMSYTVYYGWNTYTNAYEHPLNDGYVARWFDAPEPPEVPKEWRKEYTERG